MIKIKDFVFEMLDKGSMTSRQLASKWEVNASLISKYKKKEIIPTFKLAKRLYKMYNVVIYPYAEEALQED